MKKENYLPFDLETALKHPERVVTRDGRKVEQFTYFKRLKPNDHPYYGLVDGILNHWNGNGAFCRNIVSECDLFLLPEVKECWVNVCYNKWGQLYVEPRTYLEEDGARKMGKMDDTLTYIKTIRITNEPE